MPLPWLLFAFLSPLCYMVSSILDKFLIVEKMSIRGYAQLMGLLNLAIGIVLLMFVPMEWNLYALLAFIPGILWALLYVFYLKALQFEEVSRVIGMIYVFPIFVTIFAAIFLSEILTLGKYFGVLLVVGGGLMIAVKKQQDWTMSKAVPWLLVVILFETIIEIMDKYFLGSLSFWQFHAISSLGVFIGSLPFFTSFKHIKGVKFGFVLSSQLFINLANFFFAAAASLTAISVVAAVVAIQPAMTLVFAVLVSYFKPGLIEEEVTKKSLSQKGIALIIVGLGVYILSI